MLRDTFIQEVTNEAREATEFSIHRALFLPVLLLKWGLSRWFPGYHALLLSRLLAAPLVLPSTVRFCIQTIPPLMLWLKGYSSVDNARFQATYSGAVAAAEVSSAITLGYINHYFDSLHLSNSIPWLATHTAGRYIAVLIMSLVLSRVLPAFVEFLLELLVSETSPVLGQFSVFARTTNERLLMASPPSRPGDIQPYEYSPIAAGQIRVLQLGQTYNDCIPSFNMMVHNLADSRGTEQTCSGETTRSGIRQFTAISYVWGDSTTSHGLVVDGKWLAVPESTFRILTQHAPYWADRAESFLWIDSVCINQKNNSEKTVQVAQMRQVYETAATVISFIKPRDPEVTDVGVYFLGSLLSDIKKRRRGVYNVSQFQAVLWILFFPFWVVQKLLLQGDPFFSPGWDALSDLLGNDYWTRLWIVQETALGRHWRIFYGVTELSWQDIASLAERAPEDNRYVAPYTSTHVSPRSLNRTTRLIQSTMGIRRAHHAGNTIDLRQVFEKSAMMECFNPLDRIFAMHGIIGSTEATLPDSLRPDYDIDCRLQYMNVAKFFLRSGNEALHRFQDTEWLLSAAGAGYNRSRTMLPPLDDDWPSWCPDWRHKRPNLFPNMRPRSGASRVQAVLAEDQRRLDVHGTKISTITKVHSLATLIDQTIPQNFRTEVFFWSVREFLDALGRNNTAEYTINGEHLPTLLCETLTANPDPDLVRGFMKLWSSWMRIVPTLQHIPGPAWEQVMPAIGVRTILQMTGAAGPQGDNIALNEFVRQLDMCDMRVLAWTDDGRFALVPELSSCGDEIRVLTWGDTFFVLRRAGLQPEAPGAKVAYQLLGDCYIGGSEPQAAVRDAALKGNDGINVAFQII